MTENNQVRPGAEPSSYTIEWTRSGPKLIHSTWLPGYTAAHTETPMQAIEFALRKVDAEEAALKVSKLQLIELAGEL